MACYSCESLVLLGSFYCLLVLGFSVPSIHGQETVPALYVFGDSLVDVGNNNYLALALLKANFPHNGVDYPGGKATGRFSNGKNAADFLAEKVGLPTSPPYLSLKSKTADADALLKGVSFASGGAGVLNTTNSNQCLTLDKQIEYYSIVYSALVQQLGSAQAQTHLSKSLFTIVIGSNDLLGYFSSDSSQRSKITPQQLVSSLVTTLSGQLRRIYNLGARKFAVIGTGPVGCCPSQRSLNKTGECNAEANYWSVKYSEGVYAVLQGMKSEFGDMNYSFFNSTYPLLEFIQKPTDFGFVEVKAACCGLGDLNSKVPCLPIASYCAKRSDHVFWDFYHPTEAVSRMMTDAVFARSQPHVFPINVRELTAL